MACHSVLMNTDEHWSTRTPDLVADVKLYATREGGKTKAAVLGWGCPCFATNDPGEEGWDARLQLGDEPLIAGAERRIGFVFLSPKGADAMRRAGHFYLWDGRFVGEATVV